MNLSTFPLFEISVPIIAIMMLGSTHVRSNLRLYSLQTVAISIVTAWVGYARTEPFLYAQALVVLLAKALFAPWFLDRVMRRIGVASDSGAYLKPPLCMHAGILLLGVSYLLAQSLPTLRWIVPAGHIGGTAALALIFMGTLLMLTRRIAVNQVIGFLVLENGIYMFSLTQTSGMPMIVEMGILLDVLVGVMIAGLIMHRIKRSFEHIDVTRMTELRD